MAKVGDVRIVRADEHNVAVERYVEVDVFDKDDAGKRIKTGDKRCEWREVGYYGHRIEWAAESALFQAMPVGSVITAEEVRRAVLDIARATKEALK